MRENKERERDSNPTRGTQGNRTARTPNEEKRNEESHQKYDALGKNRNTHMPLRICYIQTKKLATAAVIVQQLSSRGSSSSTRSLLAALLGCARLRHLNFR